MIAIICGIEDVCVVELAKRFKSPDNAFHHLIHGLECSKTASLILVVVFNHSVVESRKRRYPGHSGCTFWVKILASRNLVLFEKMRVAMRILGFILRKWLLDDMTVRRGR